MTDFLVTGSRNAPATVLLAHGAGAPMDSHAMNAIAEALAEAGLCAVRFEFGYMAERRGGRRRPPPRAETLKGEYLDTVAAHGAQRPVVIGGKSMGGRVASMVADELYRDGRAAGLVCLGYPFHPPGKPDRLRTAHLETLETPALICQGTRDQLGTKTEIESYALSPRIEFFWLEGGDHDFKPAKGSGRTARDNLRAAADHIADWVGRLA